MEKWNINKKNNKIINRKQNRERKYNKIKKTTTLNF